MAKRVSVIDIGSNSIRMVIYQKTSRFAFHLLYEAKSKVRISEHAYNNDGNLQELPMQRTFDALKDFLSISASFKVTKTLCVATSALRDAPNQKEFLARVRNKLKLSIKVINGEKEAYYGAIACANLLPKQENALSIDIGGGSTEFSVINNNTVSNTLSFKLGTVRLKELYFDTNKINDAIAYIDAQLDKIPEIDNFTLVGIGGTFRAVASAIMKQKEYPLDKLHAFECSKGDFLAYIDTLLKTHEADLGELGIKKNRHDIIKPGALILQRLLIRSSIKNIITSGVGVRDGVFLADLLRNSNDKFPVNYNTSVRYILDANKINNKYSSHLAEVSKKLFDLTYEHLSLDTLYRQELIIASKLFPTGSTVHFYSKNIHAYYLIKSALEYGFTHPQIMLIATLARYARRKFPSKKHLERYKNLLPDEEILNKLTFLISLSIALLSHKPRNLDFDLEFKEGSIQIKSENNLYLAKENVEKMMKIEGIEVSFLD